MAWRFEHSAESEAEPQDVWRRYVDVEHWREWSQQGVEWSRLDGPFQAGTTGKMKSPGLRPVTFKLLAAEPDAFFASEVKVPGARLRFEHAVVSSASRAWPPLAPDALPFGTKSDMQWASAALHGKERCGARYFAGQLWRRNGIGDSLNPRRSR